MMTSGWTIRLGAALLGLLLAGSAGFAGPLFTDAMGDHVGVHDIKSIQANLSGGTHLVFDIQFHTSLSDPSLGGSPDDLFGFLDLDTDRNTATGETTPGSTGFTGNRGGVETLSGLGVDYYVDLVTIGLPGQASIIRTSDLSVVGQATVVYNAGPPGSVQVSVLLSDIGLGSDVLHYGFTAIDLTNGVISDDLSAIDPNVGTLAVPEPGTLTLVGLGMLGVFVYRRRR
jgi:hypothetical protein